MRASCLRFFCLCAVLFLCADASLFGTLFSWKSLGPDGALPGSLVQHPVDPNILFMSSPQGGVYRSTDGGQTWVSCTRGLPIAYRSYFYGTLSIGPLSPYPVYVSVSSLLSGLSSAPAIWRSTDLGKTWSAFGGGEVTPDPLDPQRIYITRRAGIHTFERGSSLAVSTDGGEQWDFVYYNSEASYLIFCPHPTRPGLLFMVKHSYSEPDRLLRSSDGGQNWTSVRSFPTTVSTIVCDKTDPDLVYVGTSGGLYVSENAGWIWSLSNGQPGDGNISTIDVRPDGSLLVRAGGLFKSSDRGASWSSLPPLPEGVREVFASKQDSRVIFAMTKESLLRTDNEGIEWRAIDRGISNYEIVQIAVDRLNPGKITVLATSTVDLFRSRLFNSTDYGKSWTNLGSPDQGLYFSLLRVDPKDANDVYLGFENALWKSTDGGKAWTDLGAGITGMHILDLLVRPDSNDLLIADWDAVYRSTDGGASWVKTSDMSFDRLIYVNGSTVLGGSSKGVYKSVDSGKSWAKILDVWGNAIAVDPRAPENIYVANADPAAPLFRTSDGGQTWHRLAFGIRDNARTVAVSNGMVVVGSSWSGAFVSRDQGATWQRADEGLESPVTTLAVDPQKPGSVYLGTGGEGLFSLVSRPGNRLVFPILGEDDRTSTGIALTNPLDHFVDLHVTARAQDGSLLPGSSNPYNGVLGGFQQLALTGSQLFGLAAGPSTAGGGWFQLETTADLAPVFVVVGRDQADGSGPAPDISRILYFSRVYQGPGAFKGHDAITTLTLVNPNDGPTTFRAFLLGPDHDILAGPRSYSISPHGAFRADVSTMFDLKTAVQDAFVDILVGSLGESSGVTGFEWIEFPAAKTAVGLPAHTTVIGESGYSAQLSTIPGAMTNLKLANVTDQPRTVKLEATGEDGKPLAPAVVLSIPPWVSVEKDVTELFGFGSAPVVGSLKVTPDAGGLVGDVLFGEFEHMERASALPLDSNPSTRMVFSQVANGMGYYTGLAVLNPGQEAADVKVRVFSAEGRKTGETTLNLPPGGRVSRLLTELVPGTTGQVRGYIILESNRPIVAQELFAAEKFLVAVPGSVGP